MSGLTKSPWIIHYDASSCNGCDIETLACLTPIFDAERLGVINTGNPKHADIFLVTGAVNEQSKAVIRNIYHQLPEPKVVVAVGICASSGGIFRECYNISGGVDTVIPVDVFVPGCAARPEAIIDGVVQALAALMDRRKAMKALGKNVDQVLYSRAESADAARILSLQKTAHQQEGTIYGEEHVPGLVQTLPALEVELTQRVFIKATVNGRLVGVARGYAQDRTGFISDVIVHPYFHRCGVGRRLLEELEKALPDMNRFEASIGDKCVESAAWLQRQGYELYKTDSWRPAIARVYFQKERK